MTITDLFREFPQIGEVVWIGVRPARNASMLALQEVLADKHYGLAGDRYHGDGKRQVTLIQWEHLAVLSSLLSLPVLPEHLRRNLAIKGINLFALKNQTFRLGNAVLQTTGLCQPCSKMELALGKGAYNAMRGHGGITARIIRGGWIRVGDSLSVLPKDCSAE